MKRAAIIELSVSHGECIYSQIIFIKDKFDEVHLLLNKALEDQTKINEPNIYHHFFDFSKTLIERVKLYIKLRQLIKKHKIDIVIFNTATGTHVWELIKFIPKKIKLFGSIHDANKFIRSRTQKLISKRLNKYFVLNDYIQDYVNKANITELTTIPYYPIFFPEHKHIELNKRDDEFWIVIPGKVEQKRRDYFSLIESLQNNPISSNIKFILLGSCKKENSDCIELTNRIEKYNFKNNFKIFDGFVSSDIYFSYLENADLIMPAIEPGVEFYNTYKNSQITGAYNIAFGFGIPLLYHNDLTTISDLNKFGIQYSNHNFCNLLSKLYNNRTPLEEIKQLIKKENKFQLEFQKTNYLKFLSTSYIKLN